MNFYDLSFTTADLLDIKYRATQILRDRSDGDTAAAWTQAVLEEMVKRERLIAKTITHFSNGERRTR